MPRTVKERRPIQSESPHPKGALVAGNHDSDRKLPQVAHPPANWQCEKHANHRRDSL